MSFQGHLLSGEQVLAFDEDKRIGIYITNRRFLRIEKVAFRKDNFTSIPLSKIQKVSFYNGKDLTIYTATGSSQYSMQGSEEDRDKVVTQLLELICS